MNKVLEDFARDTIFRTLLPFPKLHKNIFKKMYAKGHMEFSLKDTVNSLDTKHLDFVMEFVIKTAEALHDEKVSVE